MNSTLQASQSMTENGWRCSLSFVAPEALKRSSCWILSDTCMNESRMAAQLLEKLNGKGFGGLFTQSQIEAALASGKVNGWKR